MRCDALLSATATVRAADNAPAQQLAITLRLMSVIGKWSKAPARPR